MKYLVTNWAQYGEDQNQRTSHLVIRDILRRLKGPTNRSKYVTVLFTKTTRIHSERILAVSPEILHTERDELALLSTNLSPSSMILRCYGPQRF